VASRSCRWASPILVASTALSSSDMRASRVACPWPSDRSPVGCRPQHKLQVQDRPFLSLPPSAAGYIKIIFSRKLADLDACRGRQKGKRIFQSPSGRGSERHEPGKDPPDPDGYLLPADVACGIGGQQLSGFIVLSARSRSSRILQKRCWSPSQTNRTTCSRDPHPHGSRGGGQKNPPLRAARVHRLIKRIHCWPVLPHRER